MIYATIAILLCLLLALSGYIYGQHAINKMIEKAKSEPLQQNNNNTKKYYRKRTYKRKNKNIN
jgi:hypothetical protein